MVSDACTELSQEMHEAALLSFGQMRSTQEPTRVLASANSPLPASEAVSLADS
jgi:hypothetical protein